MGESLPVRRPSLAAFLSAVMPGLGQFYNREWLKGTGFLVGLIVVDGALGVSADMLSVLSNFGSKPPSIDLGSFVLRMLPVTAIALWSVIDAARTAKR
jgi:hypothetical protein